MGRTQTLTLLTSPNGLKKCDNEWDEERAKRSCTKKSIMSLKKKKLVEGVYLRKGVKGGNQKFLFWVRLSMFVYTSLFLRMFVSISACGSTWYIYP